jgi:integral membrane protein
MNPIRQFQIIAIAEGISFLVLLLIAMPLKYMAGMPLAVRVVGAIHGALFVLYLIATYRAAKFGRWTGGRVAEALIATVFPIGPFLLERKLSREAAESPAP